LAFDKEKIRDQVGAEAKEQAQPHAACICYRDQDMPASLTGESRKVARSEVNGAARKNVMEENQQEG
jgi:hypothetical protein